VPIPGFTAEQSLRAFQLRYHLRHMRTVGPQSRLRLIQSCQLDRQTEEALYGFPGWDGMPSTAAGVGDGASADGTTDGTTADGTSAYTTADDTADVGTLYAGPDAGSPSEPPPPYSCDGYTCQCWDSDGCFQMVGDHICEGDSCDTGNAESTSRSNPCVCNQIYMS
jgi:hypothetical protein